MSTNSMSAAKSLRARGLKRIQKGGCFSTISLIFSNGSTLPGQEGPHFTRTKWYRYTNDRGRQFKITPPPEIEVYIDEEPDPEPVIPDPEPEPLPIPPQPQPEPEPEPPEEKPYVPQNIVVSSPEQPTWFGIPIKPGDVIRVGNIELIPDRVTEDRFVEYRLVKVHHRITVYSNDNDWGIAHWNTNYHMDVDQGSIIMAKVGHTGTYTEKLIQENGSQSTYIYEYDTYRIRYREGKRETSYYGDEWVAKKQTGPWTNGPEFGTKLEAMDWLVNGSTGELIYKGSSSDYEDGGSYYYSWHFYGKYTITGARNGGYIPSGQLPESEYKRKVSQFHIPTSPKTTVYVPPSNSYDWSKYGKDEPSNGSSGDGDYHAEPSSGFQPLSQHSADTTTEQFTEPAEWRAYGVFNKLSGYHTIMQNEDEVNKHIDQMIENYSQYNHQNLFPYRIDETGSTEYYYQGKWLSGEQLRFLF